MDRELCPKHPDGSVDFECLESIDVKLTTSLMERIFKLGTIVCYTGDVTNPELKLVHVKHSREIKRCV